MKISESLLPEFDQETAMTKSVLERCPANKFTFKPHNKSWELVRLAVHLRSFIMNHSIFHLGRLSIYLRLNDIPVPALHGPSADEGSF